MTQKTERRNNQNISQQEQSFLQNQKIQNALLKIGVSKRAKGFSYMEEAIYLGLEDTSIFLEPSQKLYPFLANKYNTNVYQIERSMQRAIEGAWNFPKEEKYLQYFKISLATGIPKVSDFLVGIIRMLKENKD